MLQNLGAKTTLISGPTSLSAPKVTKIINVNSADQMLEACEASLPADIAVCAAAVADYKIANKISSKLKKTGDEQKITLEENPDILERLSKRNHLRPKLVVGFAAETSNLERNSDEKLNKKGCDWVLGNNVSENSINLPDLKARTEDIPLLVNYFKKKISEINRVQEANINPTNNLLYTYDWPGNIRELKNVIERAHILFSGEEVTKNNVFENLLRLKVPTSEEEQNALWDATQNLDIENDAQSSSNEGSSSVL